MEQTFTPLCIDYSSAYTGNNNNNSNNNNNNY